MQTSKNTRINLLDTPTSDAGGCCGGGGCMCGGGETVAVDRDAAQAASAASVGLTNAQEAPRASAIITPTGLSAQEYLVTGMTCGHCVSSVKEEVGAIDGVNGVEVVLKKGGASRVTVTAAGPIDTDAVRSAVEEAGYQLA